MKKNIYDIDELKNIYYNATTFQIFAMKGMCLHGICKEFDLNIKLICIKTIEESFLNGIKIKLNY